MIHNVSSIPPGAPGAPEDVLPEAAFACADEQAFNELLAHGVRVDGQNP